jgi:sugar O-acyltransferase (sialic acid O-acetyltransferase NeuD family)
MKDIILVGGGGHCRSCIDVIELEGSFRIAGILDLPGKTGSEQLGYPVIGTDDDLTTLIKSVKYYLVTIGHIRSVSERVTAYGRLKEIGALLPVICSPLSYVSKHAEIGEGTIVMHSALINPGARVGVNCIINSKALVEHDAVIGNHCHISTGSIINGGTQVGERTFFGSGSVSKQYIIIPEGSFIKANTIVK